MMLDSTLGKILTKRVGPSLPINTENTAMKMSSSPKPTTSEAEVRLVVRLLVEEHIVFNGKVEEVRQLESEEVSRIVSRIAWDGAKDGSSSEETDNIRACRNIMTTADNDKHEQISCSELSEDIQTIIASKNQTDRLSREIESSNPTSHLKFNPEIDVPNREEDSVAQVEDRTDENKSTFECDREHVEKPFNHICETSQQSQGSNQTQEILNNYREELNDACAESQSIADTLNDCVNSVDLESRQLIESNDVVRIRRETQEQKAMEESLHEFKRNFEVNKHNETTDVIKEDVERPHGAVHVTQPITTNHTDELILGSEENCFTDRIVQSNRTRCKSDLNIKLAPTKKPVGCCPGRRRNAGESGPSSKRIRRMSTKDHCNSRNTNISKSIENAATERKISENELLVANNSNSHLARQSKIFAKWSDNHFYPGTIIKPYKDRKFVISFFDGAQRNVAETDLIPLCNIGGKQVRVSIAKNYCVNAIVHDQRTPVNDQPMFDVEYQQDGIVRKCVPLKDIFLTGEQGASLINQPIKPDKNPDESMFAGVDLDNIVHVKRSRRLQEMEDLDLKGNSMNSSSNSATSSGSKRKRGQYNMRNITPRTRTTNVSVIEEPNDKSQKRFSYNSISQDTPASSCSPDNIKTNLHCPNSNPPSEGSNSTESSNTPNVLEMGQEFYFDSSSTHRTETSLLL